MEIIKLKNYEEMSDFAAGYMIELIKNKPNAVLGLATGSTPIGLYQRLIKANKSGEISFKDIKTVNLDEYVGLGADSNQSYVYFMSDQLFNHVDIDNANTNLPSGTASDMQAECQRYTELLQSMPQDVQVLGLGSDGHIGFNEPGSPFNGHTHVVELTESTIKDNSRLFERIEDVPTKAITMGVADIMNAKKILILASGKNKAQAVYDMVVGKVDEKCPASVLQNHADVTVVLDEEAASLLK